MGDIAIREIEKRDHAQWQSLFVGYNACYGRVGPTALPDEVVETSWQRFFDPGEPIHALVAEHGGQLVGLAHYLFHRSTTQVQLTCYLQDLYTSEQSRGAGVGRRLILAVYDRAQASGSSRVYWQTHETNGTAMQLYDKVAERSGFIVYRKLFYRWQRIRYAMWSPMRIDVLRAVVSVSLLIGGCANGRISSADRGVADCQYDEESLMALHQKRNSTGGRWGGAQLAGKPKKNAHWSQPP